MRDVHAFERQPIDELYRWFASESEVTSPTWGRLCRWIAEHPEVNERLDALPGAKRQPNVFLGALKYLGGPTEPGDAFAAWVREHWDALEAVILSRATQTNEPGRLAVFAPLLASLPQPLALLEVGSSAGLCLLPDLFRYAYSSGPVEAPGAADPDAPLLECAVEGTPPTASIEGLRVASRAGLDLNPLDAADPDDARWLRSLVWPGEDAREARLAASLALAARVRPPIARGDLRSDLGRLLERAAPGATPVIYHSAALAYLTRSERDAFELEVRGSGVRWISYEGPSVMTSVRARLTDQADWEGRPNFVVALDGRPVARASAHGGWVRWY